MVFRTKTNKDFNLDENAHKSGSDPPIWPPINHLHISPDITNCANQVEESIKAN